MNKIIIFGAGYPIILQLIHDINRSARKKKFEIAGFCSDDERQWGTDYFGYPILGALENLDLKNVDFIINNVGSSTRARKSIDARIYQLKDHIPSLIHPTVESMYSKISPEGCVLSKDVFIGAGSEIGDSCCLRNTVFVGNENIIGNHVFISDQSVLLGYVKLEDLVYIGAHVTVLPRLVIKEGCLLGAGAVVTKDTEAKKVYIGNPARFLKELP